MQMRLVDGVGRQGDSLSWVYSRNSLPIAISSPKFILGYIPPAHLQVVVHSS